MWLSLRAFFRIGQPDGALPKPVYPPTDTLNYLGVEEIFVSLSLLVIAYIVLATPCWFSDARPSPHISDAGEGWMFIIKQLQHVRDMDDFKQWWHQLCIQNNNRQRRNNRQFDPRRWNQLMQARYKNGEYDSQETVRTKGGDGGRSTPSTPLRTFFRPLAPSVLQQNKTMHASTSDGHLLGVDSPMKHGQNSGLSDAAGDGESSFYDEDFRPETDHDRFEEAWKTHVRFSEYRRLVLPPECKLVEFTSTWREAEQSLLENFLLDESRWNKMKSFVQNVLNMIHGISTKLFSKDSMKHVAEWMMDMGRYRMRKMRGMSVEDEENETDNDDDDSVATLASSTTATAKKPMQSSATKMVSSSTGRNKLPEITPVISNRKNLRDNAKVVDGQQQFPPLDTVPQLVSPGHPKTPKEQISGSENDSSIRNVPQSQSASTEKGLTFDDHSFSRNDTDDATFVSAAGLDLTDLGSSFQSHDIPSSVGHTPTKSSLNVSPLPMKHFARQKKKDALEKYREPDISHFAPIALPSLKSSGKELSPMPSPTLKPQTHNGTALDVSANMDLSFFDTANSDRQLRDMSRAVPIPDANGYILGDEFLGSSCTPLLVFVNSRSGPQQGNLLITQFRRLLNPIQVWDLANGGPEKVLKSFSVLSRLQVLVCGGDGTVSWIISALEKMKLKRWPAIGILPLGTGNDLARIHGWGGGYNNESLLYILRQISEAYISMLDLWELDITSTSKKGRKRKESKSFLNYLGVGVDAQAALQVHNLRESKPKLFFSRFFNKAWYAIAGGEEAIKSSCANLAQQITLVADGVEIPLPPDSQGIIFLNIDSYSGGVPLWSKGLKPKKKRVRRYSEGDFLNPIGGGMTRNDSIEDLTDIAAAREVTACDLPSSCQDGLLGVVSIRGTFHLGQIRVGLSNAQLLCQCREATVKLEKKIAVQIDGEPWRQNPSTLRIVRKPDRANMLNRTTEASGGVETEVTKLLNWANESEVIDQKQYAL